MRPIVLSSKSKYRNKQIVTRGHVFDSIKESERYLELSQWQREGKVQDLILQPPFILQVEFIDAQGKKHMPIIYFADFMYRETKNPEITIVEDVKAAVGFKTEIYKLKKKLFLYKYRNVVFKETY